MTNDQRPTPLVAPLRHAARAASLVGAVAAVAHLAAITSPVGPADLERALATARGAEAARARFHETYVFPVKASPVEKVEVVTEFRRAVMITEEHLRQGDWIFGQGGRNLRGESAASGLIPWKGRVTVAAHVAFGPTHAYATVPPLEIALDGSPPIVAVDARTIPQSSLPFPLSGGRSGQTTSLVGADVEHDFVATAFGLSARQVRVFIAAAERARVAVDFGRLE